MTMDTVPKDQRIYPSCVYPVACVIIVMYVDNNGVWHNCEELLAEFEAVVRKDGRIDLHREGDMYSFLSVRYLNNPQTGEITTDQEAYIDTLLAKYNMTDCSPNDVPLKTSVNLDEIAARLPRTPHPLLIQRFTCLPKACCATLNALSLGKLPVWRFSRQISFRALRNLCLFRCKLGRDCFSTKKLSQLSHLLQQRSVQLEIFSVFCTCHVFCGSWIDCPLRLRCRYCLLS